MSTRYGRRKVKKNKNRSKVTGVKRTAVIFFFTLSLVLLVGLAAITLFGNKEKSSKKEEKKTISYTSEIASTIPEKNNDDLVEEVPEADDDYAGEALQEDTSKYGSIINDSDYLLENNIFVKEGSKENSITLGFCGDMLFDDEYACMAALILRGGEMTSGMSEDTLALMNSVDVMVVNNEFPYTSRGTRQPEKTYTFRADPYTAEYLNEMGADVAIIANNHVYDFGEQGLLDTLDTLKKYGVLPLGAGRNLEEAMQPVYYIVNDIKVAVIAATQIERLEPPDTVGATDDRAGVFRCWNSSKIYDVVAKAKENADFVIACIHWGTEREELPDTWQTQMAPKLAEAGADLIVGDHPHRLQGIYYYGDTPCIYSLGNFWFNGFTLDTGILTVEIDKEGMKSLKFIPAIQQNMVTKLVYGEEQSRIINYMRTLSKGAYIDDDGEVYKGDKKTVG